jgi:hypothetical protein
VRKISDCEDRCAANMVSASFSNVSSLVSFYKRVECEIKEKFRKRKKIVIKSVKKAKHIKTINN